jgi:hypothetical protein
MDEAGDVGALDAPASAPLGENAIVAVILPAGADLEKAAKEFEGAGSFDRLADVLAGIAERTVSQDDVFTWVPRAMAIRRFEIVDEPALMPATARP